MPESDVRWNAQKIPVYADIPQNDSRDYYHAFPVRSVIPFWRSRRGYMVHVVRAARVYSMQGRLSVTWVCGNQASDPIAFRPECSEGLTPCRRCFGMSRDVPMIAEVEEWLTPVTRWWRPEPVPSKEAIENTP